MCQLLSPRSYQLIPGDAPNPLSFPKGFSIAVGLHLQQPSPLLSRNAVMLTNLFSSHCFFLGADLLLGFSLWFTSAQTQPGSGCPCLWCRIAKQQQAAIVSAQQCVQTPGSPSAKPCLAVSPVWAVLLELTASHISPGVCLAFTEVSGAVSRDFLSSP